MKKLKNLEIIFSDKNTISKSDFSIKKIKAISFFYNPESFQKEITDQSEGNSVNLLANFDLSLFGGKKELRLKIIDIF
ncbi:MAG: hypothetical protein AAB693_01140 [Patescibacteria group bacterium]